MAKIKPALLKKLRSFQDRGGHVMKGKTGKVGGEEFSRRVSGLVKHAGFDKETARKIVGKQYWKMAKEKFKVRVKS